jgi:hypothetical protein
MGNLHGWLLRPSVVLGLACLPLLSVAAHAVPVTGGLVAYYAGENNADDGSGNAHHGTLVNGGYATGVVGQAFNLQGSGNYVDIPDSPAWAFGANDFTIAFFANVHSNVAGGAVPSPAHVFIGQDEGGGVTNKWFVSLGGGTVTLHINNAGPSDFLGDASYPPTPDAWHHVTIRRTGATFETFIDGVLAGSEVSALPVGDVAHTLRLGEAEGFELDGLLDEVAIYDRALTGAEIVQLANDRTGSIAEPGTLALLGVGLIGLGYRARRSRRRRLDSGR